VYQASLVVPAVIS